jgi:dynein heavy chain
MVDQEKLERIESAQWRSLVFTICFLHSIVQERRKFGPLGWCIPYEYNGGDLSASLGFLEKHLYSGAISWPTLQYMVSDVQYGGRITDNIDRRMFQMYAEAWLGPTCLAPTFTFNPDSPVARIPNDFVYRVPQGSELQEYQTYIQEFPEVDSPEIFGLHPNADLTFRANATRALLTTIMETQPKESGAAGGLTREDLVAAKAAEMELKIPADYVEDQYKERINQIGGLDIPLNIFLFQEIQRLQLVIANVRRVLGVLQQAIRGEVVLTSELAACLDAIYDARVPLSWVWSPGGDEISWICPTLGLWFTGLEKRDGQTRKWLSTQRPSSFWLTGFFNAQGFLTSMCQEVTRLHTADKWALDDVVFHTEVTEFERAEQVRQGPREGVFIHGLFLDGAGWSRGEGTVVESEPKKMFAVLPVLFVTAVTKAQKKNRSADYGPYGGYECPCYKYPVRNDKFLIFMVTLSSREHRPMHWALRGVALLCTTD